MPSPEYQKYRKFLEQGAFSEAARLAEKQYLGGDKDNPFWLTRQAGALSRAGKYNASLAVARQALELGQDWVGLMTIIPERIPHLLDQVQRGDLVVGVRVDQLDELLTRVERVPEAKISEK